MRLLKVRDVAAILQVSLARVYELARMGLIPYVRLGRQVRFDETALQEWIKHGGSVERKKFDQRGSTYENS